VADFRDTRRSSTSSKSSRFVTPLLGGACIAIAVAAYIGGYLPPGKIASWRPLGMRLDPTEMSPIENRRGQHGGPGGDLSRLGPPPWWGEPRGGDPSVPQWDDAHGDGRPYRRWRDCSGRPGTIRRCGPWQDGPAPGDEGDL
jgi:hypothetical protein